MTTTLTIAELEHAGERELGTSEWHDITQAQVNGFAEATGDHQWIHVDPERAKDGPFGGPVAHGYLTLAMLPMLLAEVVSVSDAVMGVNVKVHLYAGLLLLAGYLLVLITATLAPSVDLFIG